MYELTIKNLNGVNEKIKIGSREFQIQPSEFVKIAFITEVD